MQDRCRLGARGNALRTQIRRVSILHTFNKRVGNGPAHHGLRPGRNAPAVRERAQVGDRHGVVIHEFGIAVEHFRHLLARDVLCGGKLRRARAVDDAAVIRPDDGVRVPLTGRHIRERSASRSSGRAP